jgi:hypothetical protein
MSRLEVEGVSVMTSETGSATARGIRSLIVLVLACLLVLTGVPITAQASASHHPRWLAHTHATVDVQPRPAASEQHALHAALAGPPPSPGRIVLHPTEQPADTADCPWSHPQLGRAPPQE